MTVVDTTRLSEHRASHVTGSLHIPIHELPDRLAEVPTGEVWVYCQSGYRSGIAASMLDTDGRTVVHIDDDYDNADRVGLPITAPPSSGR
jgi:hydroxyacylglutathione hydrolase